MRCPRFGTATRHGQKNASFCRFEMLARLLTSSGSPTRLSEIGRQLNELGTQQKQAQQNGNWTENDRLQAKIAELMKRRKEILNKI
jgi:hypothetical protein